MVVSTTSASLEERQKVYQRWAITCSLRFHIVKHTRRTDTPNCSLVIAVEPGPTEFTADTLTVTIDLIIVKERPTR